MPSEFKTALPQRDLVSIVIPCYNAQRFLTETLESALTQTYPHIEVIVIDDGSTDRTAEVIRDYGNALKAESGPNRGASAARNRGTALAAGEFIQYIDADDVLTTDAIEKRLLALRETNAEVAYSDWQRFETNPDGSRRMGEIVALRMEEIDLDPEIACAGAFWAPPAAILYRRRIVDQIGSWNERLPVIQDARFLFDAARRGARFIHVQGVTAYYRLANSSLSHRNERAFVLDCYHNGIEIQSIWEARGPLTPARKALLAGIFDYVAREFFRLDMSEFADAVVRFKAVSKRRVGYPEVAYHVNRLAGRSVATTALALGMQVARGLRSLREGNR